MAAICAAAPLALANQLPLPTIVQRGWWRHRAVSSAIEESDLYLFTFSDFALTKTCDETGRRATPICLLFLCS